jgi:hypothetical protein
VTQIEFSSGSDEGDHLLCIGQHGHFDPNGFFRYLGKPSKYPAWLEMVRSLVQRSFDEPGSQSVAIVLSGRLEFLDRVVQDMRRLFPGRTVGNFSSMVGKASRLAELEKDIVVTTDKSFNGSINPVRVSHMILLAPVSSQTWVEQICGRLRGEGGLSCRVLDAWDGSFPKLREQVKRRYTILKKLSTDIEREEYNP